MYNPPNISSRYMCITEKDPCRGVVFYVIIPTLLSDMFLVWLCTMVILIYHINMEFSPPMNIMNACYHSLLGDNTSFLVYKPSR